MTRFFKLKKNRVEVLLPKNFREKKVEISKEEGFLGVDKFRKNLRFTTTIFSETLLAVRCTLYSAEILTHLEKYADAANQIIAITSGLPDIYGSIFLERATTLFGRAKMFRRQAFHSVLAGHRYEKTNLLHSAFRCYGKALPEYIDKCWENAEDNVSSSRIEQSMRQKNSKIPK